MSDGIFSPMKDHPGHNPPAREFALSRGYWFGRQVEIHPGDKMEAGCRCGGPDDACMECGLSAAIEAEMNARQYADFSSETSHYSEDDWEAFEEEISVSLAAGVRRMLLEKYGEKLLFLKEIGADRHAARRGTKGRGE